MFKVTQLVLDKAELVWWLSVQTKSGRWAGLIQGCRPVLPAWGTGVAPAAS